MYASHCSHHAFSCIDQHEWLVVKDFQKKKQGNSAHKKSALDIEKSAREMSKGNIKLKDNLIKKTNNDWKKIRQVSRY